MLRAITLAGLGLGAVTALKSGLPAKYDGTANNYAASSCAGIADADKVDCGQVGTNEQQCEAKGCCWAEAGSNSATPWCFSPSLNTGYSLSDMKTTSTGYHGTLSLLGKGTSTFGPDLASLHLEVVYETADTFHLRVTDATAARWEIPQTVLPRPTAAQVKPLSAAQVNYEFHFTSSPFTFYVTRKTDGRRIFSMDTPFVFKNQYLEIGTSIDSSARTFGIGESTRLEQALVPGSTYTLWAADIPAAAFYKNLYGSFPYYLQLHADGTSHGAMLLNSNGMDVTLGSSALTFKAIGGVIDLYVFNGPTPDSVVQQYTSVVGKPTMMPYWSFGFHNCKYGYTSVVQVEDVVKNYRAAEIPLETQWMDIDYMQDYRDFTWSSKNFPVDEVKSFVDTLHKQGQHFVPIIDPGIMVYPGYEAYEKGMQEDIFIKDVTGGYYLGQVWPGPTYFPDFLHPKAQSYWSEQIQHFHDSVPVDGLWIDMNEISNFCNDDGGGQHCAAKAGCPSGNIETQCTCCLECQTPDATNALDFPPYHIHNKQANGALSAKTVAMSSYAYGNVSSYDAHNLYGLTEQIATNAALTAARGNKRPFLLSRSSFPSTGRHSAKWTGDNYASWDDLKSSVISVLDFNLFGVPMVGADICGFLGNTNEELCARWIELGAFYPFSREHSALNTADQELYLWPSVTQAAKAALGVRYRMLPYLYTQFYHASIQGSAVARALWYNNPTDTATFGITQQFYLGPCVMVSPCLEQGATSVRAYFPKGLWYDFSTHALTDASAAGRYVDLDTPLTSTNVHISGGSVLPLQQAAMTVSQARATPFTLLVALCDMGMAEGSLFVDDGEQVGISAFLSVGYSVTTTAPSAGTLTSTVKVDSYTGARDMRVETITVLGRGIQAVPSSVLLNGKALAAAQIVYDATTKSYSFVNLGLSLSAPISLVWK